MENELALIKPENLTASLVKERICAEATDQEIFLFLQVAKACKLNPFLNQIYLVKYGTGKAQILTSYNVYLQRAERSGAYAGLETSTIGTVEAGDLKAVVKVFRKDWEKPLVHEVYYVEYVQTTKDFKTGEIRANKFWKEKPRTMITKVAISQAFRLAFPLDFEGMPYTSDEINTIDVEKVEMTSSKPEITVEPKALTPIKPVDAKEGHPGDESEKISKEEGVELLKLAARNGYNSKDVKEYITGLGYSSHKSLSRWDLSTVIKRFEVPAADYKKRMERIDK